MCGHFVYLVSSRIVNVMAGRGGDSLVPNKQNWDFIKRRHQACPCTTTQVHCQPSLLSSIFPSPSWVRLFETVLGLEGGEQTGGGGVVIGAGALGLELLLDLLGQDLSELDAPLVEAVDVPDDALGEDHVLVVGYQGAQGAGGD